MRHTSCKHVTKHILCTKQAHHTWQLCFAPQMNHHLKSTTRTTPGSYALLRTVDVHLRQLCKQQHGSWPMSWCLFGCPMPEPVHLPPTSMQRSAIAAQICYERHLRLAFSMPESETPETSTMLQPTANAILTMYPGPRCSASSLSQFSCRGQNTL
jgi:hypothetical protein